MDPAIAAVIDYVRRQRLLKDHFFVASAALMIYDYLLTVHLEVKHIWFSKWTYTKVVFLLVRYMPFIFGLLLVHIQTIPDAPIKMCSITLPLAVWMLQINMMLSETILAIRTWAIWHRNKAVGLALAVATVTFITVGTILAKEFVGHLSYGSPLYPGLRGCMLLGFLRNPLWQNYAVMTAAQTVVLTLVIASAFRSYKSGNTNELSHVIHRDGILFYVYLLIISVANVIVDFTADPDLTTLLAPMAGVMYSVLISRTILNIRSVRPEGSTVTELHAAYEYPQSVPLHLVAIPNTSQYSHNFTMP